MQTISNEPSFCILQSRDPGLVASSSIIGKEGPNVKYMSIDFLTGKCYIVIGAKMGRWGHTGDQIGDKKSTDHKNVLP